MFQEILADHLTFKKLTHFQHWTVYLGKEDGLHMLMHYWRRGGIQSDREWEEIFGGFTGGESSAEVKIIIFIQIKI